jgi:hypothetical protein
MPDQLGEEVHALRSGAKFTWAQTGQLLDAVESSRYWQKEGAASFTAWLRALAQALGRKERILWRYLSAMRYYQQLQAQLKARNGEIPTLAQLLPAVSPGHIELLFRLARVAPPDMVQSLTDRLMTSQVTRAELQRAWQTFRPALGGWTARGRGTGKPTDRDNWRQRDDLSKAVVLHELQSADTFWKDIVKAADYRFLLNIRSIPVPDYRSGCPFDAVAVVYPEQDQYFFHGIQYVGTVLTATTKRHVLRGAAFCDYLWVVRHVETDGADVKWIPDSIGLLLVKRGSVQVIRPASRTERQSRHWNALLSTVFRIMMTRYPFN